MRSDADIDLDRVECYKMFKTTLSTQYDIILSKDVSSDLNGYFDLIQTLDNDIREEDVVNIKLANYGGDVHSGVALAHSIKNCKGTVLIRLISSCYSMGAILALCGDALFMGPGNFLMFHNYSGAEVGKAGEIDSSHTASKKSWSDYLHYFCTPFLTEDEIQRIMSDKDEHIHFDKKGLKQRLKRHFPKMCMR